MLCSATLYNLGAGQREKQTKLADKEGLLKEGPAIRAPGHQQDWLGEATQATSVTAFASLELDISLTQRSVITCKDGSPELILANE